MQTVETLPDTTRLWIYQSNRPFTDNELADLKPTLTRFATQWVSHNKDLRSFAEVYYHRFIVLMVDESQAGASGCSIDSSVRFLKLVENQYEVELFNRMLFSYKDGEEVHTVSKEAFAKLYEEGQIEDDTMVFDTLIDNKGDFEAHFIKRLGDSWHKRMV